MTYPPWVVLHVPHDSTAVPADVRAQFLLDEAELVRELDRMTDHRTLAIFADPLSDAAVVRSHVSHTGITEGDVVVWRCLACGTEGQISSWQGTFWDLGQGSPPD